jgi:hypothetical protein
VGVAVKHQQLARQVGVFIEHQPENLMASFSFTSTVLDEGTTFIFDLWICIANGSGGFNSHLAGFRKPEAFAATQRSNLDELLLPGLVGEIERMSVFYATSTRTAPGLPGSDTNRSKEVTQSKSLSDLEEDLDRLLKLGDEGVTACPGGPFSTTTRTQTQSIRRLVLHLQVRAEEDSRMREPPFVERPPFLKTTRNLMTTKNPF